MDVNGLAFLKKFGELLWDALCRFKIPGTSWSAMGVMLAILLLTFGARILHGLFSALSVSGGLNAVSAGTGSSVRAYHTYKASHKGK